MPGVKKRKDRPLSPAHVVFCRAFALDSNGTDAYRKAFPGVKQSTAEVNGCKLLKNAKVQAEIARLRKPSDKAVFLTLARKRELLYGFAEDKAEETSQRLKSIELDAKLAKELNADAGPDSTPIYATPPEIAETLRLQALALWGRDEDVRAAKAAVGR